MKTAKPHFGRHDARDAALGFFFLLALGLSGWSVLGQAPAPAPPAGAAAPGAAPTPIVRAAQEVLPMDQDPDDPTASTEERLRRQKVIIMKRIEERQKMIEEATRKAEEFAAQHPEVAPTPTPLPGEIPVVPTPIPKPEKLAATVTMYLTPATVTARQGERFKTQCDMLNPDHQRIDRIEVALSYPASCIKLAAIHQDKIRPMIAGEPTCLVDEKRGTLLYNIRFVRPVNSLEIPTVDFLWEAIAPVDAAEIRMIAGEHVSRAFGGKKILSIGQEGPRSAVLGTFVRIDPPENSVPAARFLDPGNITVRQAGFPDQSRLRPPRLWIRQPEDERLEPGRWIVVDIGIDNPDKVVFDEVRLAAAFDPALVEIADTDRGNWISEGLNLLDGPFHQDWPWDRHYKNTIDTSRGCFQYRMGMTDLREQPSGTMVRLFARVRRPTTGPLFTWIWGEDKEPDALGSGIYLFNENIYRKLLAGTAPSQMVSASTQADAIPGVEKADPALYRDSKKAMLGLK